MRQTRKLQAEFALMRRFVTILIFNTLLLYTSYSQQTPLFSQYVLNEFLINPANAGIDGMTTINLSGRKQWLGWENPPETYSASISTRILKGSFRILPGKSGSSLKKGPSGRVGLGASFFTDRNGAINRTSFQFSYAYHIFIENSQLSFGLTAMTQQFKIDDEFIDFNDGGTTDPVEALVGKSTYMPDAAAGINFSTVKYHIGLSVFNIFQTPFSFGKPSFDSSDVQLKHPRHYHIIGRYRHALANPDWEVEPSFLLRTTEKFQMSADISSRLIYQKEYWGGLSIRTSGEFIVLLGMKVNRVYFGYSFDYGFNDLSRMSYGSHEVAIAIKLGDSARRYRWLQRY